MGVKRNGNMKRTDEVEKWVKVGYRGIGILWLVRCF